MSPRPTQPPAGAPRFVAFLSGKRIGDGTQAQLEAQLGPHLGADGTAPASTSPVLVFDLESGEQIEFPPASAAPPPTPVPRPGRPRLGVVAREVTLLPHDWAWLDTQPGGASVTLRKLVLGARRLNESANLKHVARVACYRFISAIAGNEAGYEEALRALFRDDPQGFRQQVATWPDDVRTHALSLAQRAFELPMAALGRSAAAADATGAP